MPPRIHQRVLAITAILGVTLAVLTGTSASADPAPTSDDLGALTYGCPGFPGSPAGGVCLYEPTTMSPRYGRFHDHVRRNGDSFTIPYLVGFIDVNSTATVTNRCGVKFYDVTYPQGKWTKTYLFTVYDDTNNGYGGYVVPGNLQTRIDWAEYNC